MEGPLRFADERERCPVCLLKVRLCVCRLIPRVEARTPLVIVRHFLERRRPGATARFAASAIVGTKMIDHGARGEPTVVPPFPEGTWLLFPGGAAPPPPADVRGLVVVDGSWHQVRRMVYRVAGVGALPRLSLPPPPPGTFRPRKTRLAEGMSTLEAIAAALAYVEGEHVAAPLRWLHDQVVERLRAGSRGLKPGDLDPDRPTADALARTVSPYA